LQKTASVIELEDLALYELDDFTELLDLTLDEESPAGRVTKSLPSSPQATKKNAKNSASTR
jgi:hypothetical protein